MTGAFSAISGHSAAVANALYSTAQTRYVTGFGPNLITESDFSGGTYTPWYSHSSEATLTVVSEALQVTYGTAINNFAEYALTGLTVDTWYRIKLDVTVAVTNIMRIRINTTASNHSTMTDEWGYAPVGEREMWFKASATSLYLAIGDDNGFSGSTNITFDDVYVQEDYTYQEPSGGGESNPYLEAVNIPTYSGSNSEHVRIPTDEPFSAATFNNASFTSFYLEPGDYTGSGVITLTADGTSGDRRYISLYSGNDLHPGQLQQSERASVLLLFSAASYWTLDRIASEDHSEERSFYVRENSTNNIFNRCFTDNIGTSVMLRDGANNNTIQLCRFQNMTHSWRLADKTCVGTYGSDATSYEVKDLKIIGNEIVNTNDGIQTIRSKNSGGVDYQDANCEGLVIDDNDVYITDELYTDGSGNYSTSGVKAYAENAIDLKIGSTNVANRATITNNRLWGYRQSDGTGSDLSSPGSAFSGHYEIKYTDIEDNVMFDSHYGLNMGAAYNFPYAEDDVNILTNIFHECGAFSGAGAEGNAIGVAQGTNVLVQYNAIFDNRENVAHFAYNGDNIDWIDNDLVNATGTTLWNDNSSTGSQNGPNTSYTTETNPYTEDYVFNTDKFTNNQRQITLENTVKP